MALTGDGRSEQEAEQSSVAAAAAIRSVLIFYLNVILKRVVAPSSEKRDQ